jgi:peroxiredoxin
MMETENILRMKTNNGGTMPVNIGAPAPEFTLKDQDQKEVKLSDFRGKKRVVLVFYPLDWTPPAPRNTLAW